MKRLNKSKILSVAMLTGGMLLAQSCMASQYDRAHQLFRQHVLPYFPLTLPLTLLPKRELIHNHYKLNSSLKEFINARRKGEENFDQWLFWEKEVNANINKIFHSIAKNPKAMIEENPEIVSCEEASEVYFGMTTKKESALRRCLHNGNAEEDCTKAINLFVKNFKTASERKKS